MGVAQARCWVLKDRAVALRSASSNFSDESLRARMTRQLVAEGRGLRHEWTALPPYDSCMQGIAATRTRDRP